METADLSGAESVLLLRYDRLGDMIISTGLFRLLAETFPRLRVHVLASPANAGAIRFDPHIHRVHIYDKRRPLRSFSLLAGLRRERFDAVVNLVFYPSLTGALLARLAAPGKAVRVRVAVETTLDPFFNINSRRVIWGSPERTVLEETVSLLSLLGGDVQGRDISPRVYPGKGAESLAGKVINTPRPRIGINLAAGDPHREWSLESWRDTMKMVREGRPGASIHIFAPPADGRGKALEEMCRLSGVHLVPRTRDILQVSAFLARMDLLVTPDTAMVHLADALGVSLVPMYISPEKALMWKPVRVSHSGLVSRDGRMDSVTPDRVFQAVSRLLEVQG